MKEKPAPKSRTRVPAQADAPRHPYQQKAGVYYGCTCGRDFDDPVHGNWTPTAANINGLPPALRRYIHDLETNADPAGTIREAICQRANAMALARRVKEIESERSPQSVWIVMLDYGYEGRVVDSVWSAPGKAEDRQRELKRQEFHAWEDVNIDEVRLDEATPERPIS